MTKNVWQSPLKDLSAEAVSAFQVAHERLIDAVFRASARTEFARSVGVLQEALGNEVVESDQVWRHLFQVGEAVIKVTSESLMAADGADGREAVTKFKKRLGADGAQALDAFFRLRCRGDHAEDVSKRGEWEQSQHEAARLLGRAKPKFAKGESELLFRPDDLPMTALEGNELKFLLLQNLTRALNRIEIAERHPDE